MGTCLYRMTNCNIREDGAFAWFVTFAAFMAYATCGGVVVGSSGILFSVFLQEFQVDRSATALMSALTTMTEYGGGVVAGYLTNRLGCRLVVVLGSICAGLAFIISSFSLSMTLIYVTQGFFKGLGAILLQQPLFVIVSKYHVKRLMLAMSIVTCGYGFGTSIVAIVLQMLINSYGWRWATRILGCVFFAMGSLTAMAFVPMDLQQYNIPRKIVPLKLSQLMKIPALRYFYLSIFFHGGYSTCYNTFLVDYAISKNISSDDAARLWTYWGIASVSVRILVGLLNSSRLARLRTFSLSFLGMAAVSWILAFSTQGYPNYTAFVISAICHGLMIGLVYSHASLCFGDALGIENVSLTMGLFYSFQMPAGVAALPLIGFITDQANGNYTLPYQILAMMQTISGLLILMFWWHAAQMVNKRKLTGAFKKHDPRSISVYTESSFFTNTHLNTLITRNSLSLGNLQGDLGGTDL